MSIVSALQVAEVYSVVADIDTNLQQFVLSNVAKPMMHKVFFLCCRPVWTGNNTTAVTPEPQWTRRNIYDFLHLQTKVKFHTEMKVGQTTVEKKIHFKI